MLVHNAKAGIKYTATTTDPDGDDIYYNFSRGNGDSTGWLGPFSSGATRGTSYVWSTSGTYDVTVRAKDTSGELSGWSPPLTVTVNAPPTADYSWSPASAETYTDITFDASQSSDSDGHIVSYHWDWDSDGVYDETGKTAVYVWSDAGSYTVTLKVTDDDGATATTTKTVSVEKKEIDTGYVWTVVEHLSGMIHDPRYETRGRCFGTPGEYDAGSYLKNELNQMGGSVRISGDIDVF